MLTLFCMPKPFRGHLAVSQGNALESWCRLDPRPEVIVFGDEEGAAQAAATFATRHVPNVARNEFGTPLISSLFEQAQRLATHDLIGYVNADIILMSDFLPAVQRVAQAKRRFLMGGQRWDLDLPDTWVSSAPDWEKTLRGLVRERGRLHGPAGIDYFVFPRGLYSSLPPFAVGRPAWDNWMLFAAWQAGAAVVDASNVVCTVHQNHDYSHISMGVIGFRQGPEARRNLELAGSSRQLFTLQDAAWRLTETQLIRAPRTRLLRRRVGLWLERHPILERFCRWGQGLRS